MIGLEAITAWNAINITESDDTIYDPPLKELLILPDSVGGSVTIKNEHDTSVVIPIDASLTAPVRVRGRVRQVMSTGTTMDNAYIFGIR